MSCKNCKNCGCPNKNTKAESSEESAISHIQKNNG